MKCNWKLLFSCLFISKHTQFLLSIRIVFFFLLTFLKSMTPVTNTGFLFLPFYATTRTFFLHYHCYHHFFFITFIYLTGCCQLYVPILIIIYLSSYHISGRHVLRCLMIVNFSFLFFLMNNLLQKYGWK